MATIIQADDKLLPRNRGPRNILFFLTPIILIAFGGLLAGSLAKVFLGDGPYFSIGFMAGALGGFIGFLAIKHIFVVVNNTTGLLVTLDQFRSILGKEDVNVLYGPGTHFSFPWEARFPENNIPVKEEAEAFSFQVICKDGTMTVPVSFRLRPDFQNPISYLSGVGAVAGDFKDLVITSVSKKLSKLTMQEALDMHEEINDELAEEFVGDNKTPFELRFGILTGDVTVGNMLMSDEAQRTRGGLNEASMVAQGTAILLGFKTVSAMMKALQSRAITQADIDRGRREFRIISGNMDGAEVKRYEVDVTGLSPEIASAVSAFLTNPAALSILAGGQGGKQPPKKGTTK